jgi:hypothetical protein
MRRIIIILFFSNFALNAQVSITTTAMPSSGDTLRYSIAAIDTAILLNYQNSGPNQVWNFDSLVPLRQGLSEFLNSSQTPYTAIPQRIGEKLADTVNLGGISLYDVYNFYNNSSTEYAIEYRGASIPTGLPFPFPSVFRIDDPYLDKDEVYQFPLNYLDRDSWTYNYVFSSPLPAILNAYYGSRGYRINEADAWGSLTTPYGTFNCLRVVTDIVGYDTIQFDTTGFGISSHRREYKWLNPNEKIPVLTINGFVTGGIFIPNLVQYRDSVRSGVSSIFSPIALFNSNATTGQVGDTFNITNNTLSLTPANYTWDIQPTSFQYVNNANANSENISLVFNQTGLYDVQLIADNGIGTDTLRINNYIQINTLTSLKELSQQDKLNIYPNPVKRGDNLVLANSDLEGLENIQLINVNGSIVQEIEFSIQGNRLITKIPNSISPSIYFISINYKSKRSIQKLFIQ